jgi:hypothetical protein
MLRANPQTGAIAQFRMILEMFHVKHFGPVGAENLTSRIQPLPLCSGKIEQFFGAIGIGLPRRIDSPAGCQKNAQM